MPPRLTVVLPLKNRLLFTFRFLWYANKMRLPYRILIADGNVKEAIAQSLENSRHNFPELDIEYVRYPDDVDYSWFFTKMADVMRRVRTPYAMMADNDDFLGFSGIESALDFLDSNADYVCARGRSLSFSVYRQTGNSRGAICGTFNRISVDRDSKEGTAPTATDRLRQVAVSHALYNSVYRTPSLVRIWQEVAEINFSDLMLHEDFHALRTLTFGKVKTNKKAITYYSQAGTGISATYTATYDWAAHLLRSRFTSDAHAVIKRISLAAAQADGVDAGGVTQEVRGILESRYRNFLMMHYGPLWQTKCRMRAKWPRLVKYLQTRRRYSVSRERSAALSQVRAAGADPESLRRIRGELAAIECALSPRAFATFAAPFLPLVGTDASGEWL
jgi:glycosyltransferase domain-containing protein